MKRRGSWRLHQLGGRPTSTGTRAALGAAARDGARRRGAAGQVDRLDRRVRALRDVVSPASSPRARRPSRPATSSPRRPGAARERRGRARRRRRGGGGLCARTEAAARDAARAAQLAEPSGPLRGWTPPPSTVSEEGGDDDAPSPRRRCRAPRSWRARALFALPRRAAGAVARGGCLLARLGRRWRQAALVCLLVPRRRVCLPLDKLDCRWSSVAAGTSGGSLFTQPMGLRLQILIFLF